MVQFWIGLSIIVFIIIFSVVLSVYVSVKDWKPYTDEVRRGVEVEGDLGATPTHWWNITYLKWRGWNTIAVFEAKTEGQFFPGVVYAGQPPIVAAVACSDKRFAIKICYEGCKCFAVDVNGMPVGLKKIASPVSINNLDFLDVRIY